MKTKLSMRLARMPIPLKIEKARHIVNSMTGNVNFTTPVPALDTITDTITVLETAYVAAQNGGPALTAVMRAKEELLDKLLTQLGAYIEFTASGDEAIAKSSGIVLRVKGSNHPYTFTAVNGSNDGEVKLTTTVTPRAGYTWQMCEDPLPATAVGNTWQFIKLTVIAKITVSNFSPGKKYWFRVATVIKDVQGPWSDPISIIAK